jgi:pimeloyl-ACP methyl ester carboxylesterase
MRGYAPTDLAPDDRYSVAALAEDTNALHEALGGDDRAVLVGHDWGAPAAYAASAAAVERWSRVVTMAVPPPARFAAGLFSYDQLKRSWYMFFNVGPLAEAVVGMDDFAFLDRLWADWSPGYDASEDLPRVKEALREPGRLAAALGYYRALLGGSEAVTGPGPQPLLYLHGADDGCVGVELAGPDAVVVEDAGHWLHLERPDLVHKHVLSFLAG